MEIAKGSGLQKMERVKMMKIDERTYRELIRIASVLAQCHYLPSDKVDDYKQKTYSAARVAKMMEGAHLQSKELAVALRNITDSSQMARQLYAGINMNWDHLCDS